MGWKCVMFSQGYWCNGKVEENVALEHWMETCGLITSNAETGMVCRSYKLGDHCNFYAKEDNTSNDAIHEELPMSNMINKKSRNYVADDRNP